MELVNDVLTKEEQVCLKLMVNKEENKVLFAEAGKDIVDVLFSFLTLPLGTIVRLFGEESDMPAVQVGSLSTLFQSVANLDTEYLCTDTCKQMLLKPRNSMEDYCMNLKLNIDDTEPTKYFVCNNLVNCREDYDEIRLSTFKNKLCSCGDWLAKPISPQSFNVFEGFVESTATFLITDDLNVVPNSFDTMFSLLKNSGIESMSSVEEMTMNITKKQVMDLLKGCLLSKTTLTRVFLEKNPVLEKFEQARLPIGDFATEDSPQINVKVVVRKSNGKIVFAQGKEDFADFLYSFLTFPLGAVLHLLQGYSCLGSVDGLYKSVVDLNEDHLKSKEVKDKLVAPRLAPQFKLSNQLLPIYEADAPRYFCYTQIHIRSGILTDYYLTSTYIDPCQWYENFNALDIVDPISQTGNGKGFAKGPTMYMATDDLVVTPMSSISVISLLNSMNIPISDLEEKVVSIGIKEGLSILKASLTSTSALTTGLSHFLTKVKEQE